MPDHKEPPQVVGRMRRGTVRIPPITFSPYPGGPMRRVAVILTAAATVAAGLAAVPAQAATLPSPPTTGYAIFTGPLQDAGWGTRFVATSTSASPTASGGVQLQALTTAGQAASTVISPPSGSTFAVGTYDIGETATATNAGVHISGGGIPVDCPATSGTLTVHEATLDAGDVTAFAASVRGNCGTGRPVFAQEIRFNSTVPMVVLTAPVSTSSKSEVVTVRAGASDATFGQAIGTGTDAEVAVTADTCSNHTVAAGASCSLTLTATPDFFGPAQDVITLPDGGAGRKIPVTVDGFDTANGAYTPLRPARLLDTRRKVGVTTTTPIGANRFVDLQVSGRGGVPSATRASSVVLNVTVVSPTSQGYVTLYPTGSSRPTASSVNFNKGWTGANLVTVKLGTGGKVRIHNISGATHVVVDVMGYYHGASSTSTAGYGGYAGITPERILDTRTRGSSAVPRGFYALAGFNFGPDNNSRIKAFAVNITVTKPTGSGYLTAWNGDGASIPKTSTVNFTTGRTVPNMAIVPVRACGDDCDPQFADVPVIGVLNTSGGNAHIIIDLVGFYDDNTIDGVWRYRPLAGPTRIVNTKTAQGIPAAIGPNKVATVTAPTKVTTFNSMALVTNTTANKPTSNTVMTLFNADIPNAQRPRVSNLNPYAGQLVSNMTITDLGFGYDFKVHNASGTLNMVLDVAGTMEAYPAVADPGAGAALRADGLSALRNDSAERATGNPRAKAPTFTGRAVSVAPQPR